MWRFVTTRQVKELFLFFSVSKTIEELRLEWKTMNPVIMGKGLRMPQFEIVEIMASDCQESFQIGKCVSPPPSNLIFYFCTK